MLGYYENGTLIAQGFSLVWMMDRLSRMALCQAATDTILATQAVVRDACAALNILFNTKDFNRAVLMVQLKGACIRDVGGHITESPETRTRVAKVPGIRYLASAVG